MAGPPAAGAMSMALPSEVPLASTLIRLAEPGDDAELRRLLRENPMAGALQMTFEREPRYFTGPPGFEIPGQTVVVEDPRSHRLIGMGSRTVWNSYCNGQEARIGYLSQLRIDASHRGGRKRFLKDAYRWWPRLHASGELSFDLTSIMSSNSAALRLLQNGFPGMPRYEPVGRFSTFLLPTGQWLAHRPRTIEVRRTRPEDVPGILDCLHRWGRRFQFAYRWSQADFAGAPGSLRAQDFLTASRGQAIVGCLALWYLGDHKQVVVRRYDGWLDLARPLVSPWLRWLGFPGLPTVGEAVRCHYVAGLAVDEDDPDIFEALLAEALQGQERSGGWVLAGLASEHPLAGRLRRYRRVYEMPSWLHLIHYPDVENSGGMCLDGRLPHPEVAFL